MKRSVLAIATVSVVLLATALALYRPAPEPVDLQVYLHDTQLLAKEGRHAEALERFVWFHENALLHDRAMHGVRLSFALGGWADLARVYPPALEALLNTRDAARDEILAGRGTWELFSDVASINRALEEDDSTVRLFEHSHNTQPHNAARWWRVARDYVFTAKRFDLAAHYLPEPLEAFQKVRQEHLQRIERDKDLSGSGDRLRIYEGWFVQQTMQLVDLAAAQGDTRMARHIAEQGLEYSNDPILREAIQRY